MRNEYFTSISDCMLANSGQSYLASSRYTYSHPWTVQVPVLIISESFTHKSGLPFNTGPVYRSVVNIHVFKWGKHFNQYTAGDL